jgi:hypothetical protein
VVPIGIAIGLTAFTGACPAAEFGADQVTKFQVPLTPPAKATIEASGNKQVTAAIGTVYLPPGFSAARTWPVMIVSATSDFNQRSGTELERYVPAARKLGWVLIAADAPATPRNDSNELRYGVLAAVLDSLQSRWPKLYSWPIASGGFSGGAKRAGILAAMLLKANLNVRYVLCCGMNEERFSYALKQYQPNSSRFRNLKIFVSNGTNDKVSQVVHARGAVAALRRNGFANVRFEQFGGSHEVYRPHVEEALRWFAGP